MTEKEYRFKKWVIRFGKDVLKEFRKGIIKVFGWTLPVIIFVFLFDLIGGLTWNNTLKITDLQFEPCNNMVVDADDNSSLYSEKRIDGTEDKSFSYSYETCIKGHGKILSADIFYSYKETEDLLPVKIEIDPSIFRIVHVSPSIINFQVTFLLDDVESNKYKRAYLVLEDEETHKKDIYLLLISIDDGEIKYFSEEEISQIAPMDQNIEQSGDIRLQIAFNKEKIVHELLYVQSFYR